MKRTSFVFITLLSVLSVISCGGANGCEPPDSFLASSEMNSLSCPKTSEQNSAADSESVGYQESSSESFFEQPSSTYHMDSVIPSSSFVEDMSLGVGNFPLTEQYFSATSRIFYWRDPAGKYRFGVRAANASSTHFPIDTIQAFINQDCPWYVMRQIISNYYGKYPTKEKNNIFIEIPYPLEKMAAVTAANMDFNVSTRNYNLYEELGLTDLYDKYYADSRQIYFEHYGLFDGEISPAYSVYPAYFTNLSHIYRWTDNNGDIRYGVGPQEDGKLTSAYAIPTMQQIVSCSFEEIKNIISTYYRVTNVAVENIIVDIPWMGAMANYEKLIASKYPENVSTDKELYEELGIIDGYNSFFCL